MDESTEKSSAKLPKIQGYTPVKLLGHGRTSEVYSVRDSEVDNRTLESWKQGVRLSTSDETGQVFALKVIHSKIPPTQEAIEILQRDLENIKALRHPNIVQLYDYGYWGDRFFLLLEYCQGGTVAKMMQHRGCTFWELY